MTAGTRASFRISLGAKIIQEPRENTASNFRANLPYAAKIVGGCNEAVDFFHGTSSLTPVLISPLFLFSSCVHSATTGILVFYSTTMISSFGLLPVLSIPVRLVSGLILPLLIGR